MALARARARRGRSSGQARDRVRAPPRPQPDLGRAGRGATPCSGRYDANGAYSNPDAHGHDANPGCDLDPRPSEPIHQGGDLRTLFSEYPNVIAYVAGHTHANKVLACGAAEGCTEGGNWWELTTSSVADWPQQSRLVEVMDNRDGTLSIFGTMTDPAARLGLPPSGGDASAFGGDELASISRGLALNDPQLGDGTGEGDPADQNVELLVDDPRTAVIKGTAGDDVLRGTSGNDVIVCGPGDDRVIAGAGDDVIRCGPGDDRVRAGRGHDRVSGGSGNDTIVGGPGHDRLFGRSGRDRVFGRHGRDLVRGNSGKDRLFGGRMRDRVSGGPGNDLLVGGPGRDALFGGPGRDRRRQ